jgi:hypothetical protein
MVRGTSDPLNPRFERSFPLGQIEAAIGPRDLLQRFALPPRSCR